MSLPAAVADSVVEVAEIAGTTVAAHFGDPAREYEGARHGVGLAHRSQRALVRVSGSDRYKFLQAQRCLWLGGGRRTAVTLS